MNRPINLSYIITTRNRLTFLKITLQNLLDHLQTDEEIVVVDGQSTDGTQEYLAQLYSSGKINQYLSEPDRNQAHGWNKATMLARGTLIKKIIDDDVFCYSAINKCKTYMLQNAQVDVVISNDLTSSLNDHHIIHKKSRLKQFKQWQSGHVPSFTFSDVHMLIRRSALAYIGLYNTAFTMIDWEYALRISYKQANIAYYTGYNSLSVGHPQSVTSLTNKQHLKDEGKLGARLYNYPGDKSEMSYWSRIKVFIGSIVFKKKLAQTLNKPVTKDVAEIYQYYDTYLRSINDTGTFTFIN